MELWILLICLTNFYQVYRAYEEVEILEMNDNVLIEIEYLENSSDERPFALLLIAGFVL